MPTCNKHNLFLISIMIFALLSSGCANSNYGPQQTTTVYYPQCYSPIQKLRAADSKFNTTVATSTAVGVGLGILAGLLIYGSVEGAVAGGVIGGVSGATIGYSAAKRERYKDDNLRMQSYLSDLEGDISNMDTATASARLARQCYDNEFRIALTSFREKKITKNDFRARLNEIKSGSNEAATILGQIIDGSAEKETAYQKAITDESRIAKIPVPETTSIPSEKTVAETKPATETKPTTETKTVAETKPATKAKTVAETKPATKTVTKKTTSPAHNKSVPTQIKIMADNKNLFSASRLEAAEEEQKLKNLNKEMEESFARLDS